MAHFYGILKGTRGQATRLGDKRSGLRTLAASWQGAVEVQLTDRNGTDYAEVWLRPWHGTGGNRRLYDGPVDCGRDTRKPGTDRAWAVLSVVLWDLDERGLIQEPLVTNEVFTAITERIASMVA
jgi:hypothetical protein